MGKVIVSRLRLNHLYVGYRVEATKTNGKRVYFDVSNELLEPFLKLFDRENIARGGVIEGRDVGGVFVTDNEKDVYEVETRSKGKMLVNKYFRCDPSYMSEDEYYNHLMSYITGSRVDLSKIEYGSFGDVPKVYSLLEKAASGVGCNIWAYIEDSIYNSQRFLCFRVVFVDLKDQLEFICNLLSLLNRKVWSPEVEVWGKDSVDPGQKKYRIPYTGDKSEFIRTALEKFGIPNKKYLRNADFMISGSAGFGGHFSHADIRPEEESRLNDSSECYCFSCVVPIPDEGMAVDESNPQYRVAWASPVKKTKPSNFLTVSRCNVLISSFVKNTFIGNMNVAFTKMLHMGFEANELAGRFGFTKEIYECWLESADPADIVRARKSLQVGRAKITLKRYKELLNEVIDFVMVGESLGNSIRALLDIGFTADELVNYFNFNKSDVERCLDSD